MARMKTNCKLYWASFLKLNYCVFEKWPKISHTFVFPLISLQASCQEHSGGGAGKGRRVVFVLYCSLKLLLWNLNICIQKVDAKFPWGSLSTELSDFSQST